MAEACWQPAAIRLPDDYTFANPQTFSVTGSDGNAQIVSPALIESDAYFELHLISHSYAIGLGICSAATAAANPLNFRENFPTQPGSAFIAENGAVICNTNVVAVIGNLDANSRLGVKVSPSTATWQVTQDGTTWQAALPIGFSGPYVPLASGLCSVTIASSAETCAWALPAGCSYLPVNSFLVLSSEGSAITTPLHLPWVSTNGTVPAGLNAIVNGGAIETCAGVTTGASGVALAAAVATQSMFAVTISDAAFPLGVSKAQTLYAYAIPANSGAVIGKVGGSFTSASGEPVINLGGVSYCTYVYYYDPPSSGGIFGPCEIGVYQGSLSAGILLAAAAPTATLAAPLGLGTDAPSSGPANVAVSGPPIEVSGTLAVTRIDGASIYGTVTSNINGTISQWGSVESPLAWAASNATPFETAGFSVNPLFTTVRGFLVFFGQPSVNAGEVLLCAGIGM